MSFLSAKPASGLRFLAPVKSSYYFLSDIDNAPRAARGLAKTLSRLSCFRPFFLRFVIPCLLYTSLQTAGYLPRPLLPESGRSRVHQNFLGKKCVHILAYLERAESIEVQPWQRDDLRVAWKTVLYAAQGHPDPWGYAFWSYYGKTWEKALAEWAKRDRSTEAILAKIEAEYQALPAPKKPAQSERRIKRRDDAA